MTEAVAKHIKKLHQLEKKAICRFADLSIWRFVDEKIKKRIKNTVLRRCCRLIKQCFFVLVVMKSSVYKILL